MSPHTPDDLGLGLPRAASPFRRLLVAGAVALVCAAVPVLVMNPASAPTGAALPAGSHHASPTSVPIVEPAAGAITTPVTPAAGASASSGLGAASSSPGGGQVGTGSPAEAQVSRAAALGAETAPTHVTVSGAALARVAMKTGAAATMLAHVASSVTHRAARGVRTITTDLRRATAPTRHVVIAAVGRLRGIHGHRKLGWERGHGFWHPGHVWRHVGERRHHGWTKAIDGRAGYRRGHAHRHGHAYGHEHGRGQGHSGGWALVDRHRHGGWWGRDGDDGGHHDGWGGDHRHRHAD